MVDQYTTNIALYLRSNNIVIKTTFKAEKNSDYLFIASTNIKIDKPCIFNNKQNDHSTCYW